MFYFLSLDILKEEFNLGYCIADEVNLIKTIATAIFSETLQSNQPKIEVNFALLWNFSAENEQRWELNISKAGYCINGLRISGVSAVKRGAVKPCYI